MAAVSDGKRVPRELRNLALPDREWNIASCVHLQQEVHVSFTAQARLDMTLLRMDATWFEGDAV